MSLCDCEPNGEYCAKCREWLDREFARGIYERERKDDERKMELEAEGERDER